MSNLLTWSPSGRSGPYKATAHGAWYGGDLVSTCGADMPMKHDKIKAHREFCQLHAWTLVSMVAIEDAICIFGVAELAYFIKVDSSRLSKWKRGVEAVPPKHCERISKLTLVPVETLRPDLEFYQGAGSGLSWRKRSLTVGGAES